MNENLDKFKGRILLDLGMFFNIFIGLVENGYKKVAWLIWCKSLGKKESKFWHFMTK